LNTIFLEELRQDTEKKAQLQLIKENKKRKREEAKKNQKKNKKTKVAVISEDEESDRADDGADDGADDYACDGCGVNGGNLDSWIGCDFCPRWFHFSCTKQKNTKDEFKCKFCMTN